MNDRQIKPEEYFHLRDGRVLKDLKELMYSLKGMDDGVFSHHITQDKNDFGNWILHVFKEQKLAEQVFRSKNKEEIIEALEFKLSPALEQPEIEDHHEERKKVESVISRITRAEPPKQKKAQTEEPPKRFDFREQMASQFQTIKEAFVKTKQEVGREGILLGEDSDVKKEEEQPSLKFERTSQEPNLVPENNVNLPSIDDYSGHTEQKDDEYIGSHDEPDLSQIVADIKKKRGRPRKEEPHILTEPVQSGTDVNALSKASELVKAFPFERTTAGAMNDAAEAAQQIQKTGNEILEKEKETSGKLDELLLKERELDIRETKILEVEERLEKELLELAHNKDPRFFTKEFTHGLLIGLLTALIIALVFVKFWG